MSAYSYPSSGNDSQGIIRNSDGAYIPNDPGNRDWQTYQSWLAEGGVPDSTLAVSQLALANGAAMIRLEEDAARLAAARNIDARLTHLENPA